MSDRYVLRIFILVVAGQLASGCKLAANNSTARDSAVFGAAVVGDGTASGNRFARAQNVLRKNCVSCHTHSHADFVKSTDAEWLRSGYISASDPGGSLLFRRIKGNGLQNLSDQTMPEGGALNASDIAVIRDWIMNIAVIKVEGDAASRTKAALQVLAHSCTTCHSNNLMGVSLSYKDSVVMKYNAFASDAEFVQSGLVQPGSPESSWLYRALKGRGGDIGTMPKNGDPLPTAYGDAIYNWISKMGEP